MQSIDLCGEHVSLLAERAMWWPARSTLFLADIHLGKGASFRAGGIAVPQGSSAATLERFNALLERTGARRTVFLGDLLHSRDSRDPHLMQCFAALRRPGSEWLLVRGNHDRHAGIPAEAGLEVVEEGYADGPFALCHHPDPRPGLHVLAGHVHPGVRIAAAGDRLRLPCFAVGPEVTLLPAFGSFTGQALVSPGPALRCYACAGDRVLEVPHSSARGHRRA